MARSRDTMNRPDSSMLNASAEPTVAAKAFEKAVKENSVTPAIATGFVPPVIAQEDKGPEVKRSPFKQIKTEGDTESASASKNEGKPAIASGFIPMPGYMKKQEINPFKSNKGPVKRPASASVNHAAVADEEEEEITEEKEHSSERPSLTAALAGHEVHSTFRPTEFKTQDKKDPFKRNSETEVKTESDAEPEPEPKRVPEKKAGPTKRRSPFQTMRMESVAEPAPAEPEPVTEAKAEEVEAAPIAAEEPVAEPAPVEAVEPEPETVAAPDPEPEIEQSPFKAKESEPEAVAEEVEPEVEPVVEEAPVQAKEPEPEPELVFPSYTDEDIDLEPLGDTSPFKPLDHEIDVNDEPSSKPQRSEPTFYTSGTEEKSRGGLLGGLFKKR